MSEAPNLGEAPDEVHNDRPTVILNAPGNPHRESSSLKFTPGWYFPTNYEQRK